MGASQVVGSKPVSYDDWVEIANDFINFELESDPRPIVLYLVCHIFSQIFALLYQFSSNQIVFLKKPMLLIL
ncbi:hypothetical protein V1525DRAFT_410886 [Lipomyces kononenkoae]|uniref:Uncharacterized protein n=1 Tax=Lipomyces kononenkoae TaxID=34357 RepID=A0ACC3STZ8_LIPKO